MADLLAGLDRTAIEPILVTPWPSSSDMEIVDEVKAQGIKVYHRDLGIWFPPKKNWGLRDFVSFVRSFRARAWALTHLIQDHGIELVYTNALPSPDAAITARHLGLPHIWHLHEAVCGNRYLRPYLPCPLTKRMIRGLSQRIITVSRNHALEFAGSDFEQAGVRVVHNGVNLNRFMAGRQSPSTFLETLGLAADTRLVALVGIVSAHKGHDTLVKSARRVLERFPNTVFLLVGSELGDFGAILRSQIDALGMAGRFLFLGPRNDVPDILGQVELLVLASTQESFSLALIEAMASGKPVVATRCGGPEEIVLEGETGFLIPIGDEQALADRIVTVLADPAAATRMGQAGRRRAEAVFSVQAYARNIQNLIEEAYRAPLGIRP